MDDLAHAMMARARPTRDRPLAGLTILLVEDSRFASEAVRLLCLRSGGRLRRADCVAAARRHMSAYRPDVAIVDLGLPDGSGASLIAELAAQEGAPALLGLSGGDPGESADIAARAGAQAFLSKPVASLAAFQQTVLGLLPPDRRPSGLGALPTDLVSPDRLALAEDYARAERLLADDPGFAAGFVAALARDADDMDLLAAALAAAATSGDPSGARDRLRGALATRRAGGGAL